MVRCLALAGCFLAAAFVSANLQAAASGSQNLPGQPVQIPNSRQWDVKSATTGRTYRVFVAWPLVGKPARQGYPVVYVLDGNSMFATVVEQSRREALVGELKPAVIVGIGYPTDDPGVIERERIYDLSPPASAASLPPMLKAAKTGGADGFTKFILTELKPKIESFFPVDRDDTSLVGHSLGGLLVLDTLFEYPRAFRSYVAISPALWWNDGAVLRREPAFAKQVAQEVISPRILLMAGGLEQTATAGPRPAGMDVADYAKLLNMAKMIDNVQTLAAQLHVRQGKAGYVVETRVLQDQTHNSEIPAALARALGFVLGGAHWQEHDQPVRCVGSASNR